MIPGGKGGRCVGLKTLPFSCADCLEIWGASTSWNHQGLSRPVMGLLKNSIFDSSPVALLRASNVKPTYSSNDFFYTVPLLGRLVAEFFPKKLGFNPKPVEISPGVG